jgi:uncharacterized membrane protein YkoI
MLGLQAMAVAALIGAALTPGLAQEVHRTCLSPDQRREAVSTRKAIPLTRVVRAIKARGGVEVVRAQLCQQGKSLVYVLTVLSRDGKVTHATVDATSGTMISGG